jgi:hypothetical protein
MREAESGYLVHTVTLTSKTGEEGFVLTPLSLTPPGRSGALTLGGVATTSGLTLHFAGTASEAQIKALRALAPPLGDGLEEVLKPDGVVATGNGVAKGEAGRVMKVDATCTRAWGAGQTCVAGAPVVAKRRRR